MHRGVIVRNSFYDRADSLRGQFEARQGDVRGTRRDRFVWDYWHVPGQYSLLRTPAWEYFAKAEYERWHRRVVAWGRAELGCHDISPPWLSLYVDGCEQHLHGDLPHGPWAFVYSLSRGRFAGGETLIARDSMLDYWANFKSVRSVEEPQLLRAVAPRYNRLVCFDPKLPHGVRRVSGPRDPLQGRLVVHGWFVQPRPFISGPARASTLSEHLAGLSETLGQADVPLAGMASWRVTIAAAGHVQHVRRLADTTQTPSQATRARRQLLARLEAKMATWRWPRAAGVSHATVPLIFERR